MNITIARRNSKYESVRQNDLQQLPQLIDISCTQSSFKTNCIEANSACKENQIDVGTYKTQWILKQCLKSTEVSEKEAVKQFTDMMEQVLPQRSKNSRLNSTNNYNRDHRIKVSGSKTKTNEDSRQYPKSLQKIKDLKSQKKENSKFEIKQHKIDTIIESKTGTPINFSPNYSRSQSAAKFHDDSAKSTSLMNSSNHKIRLTVVKQPKIKNNSQDIAIKFMENSCPIELQKNRAHSFRNKSIVQSDLVKSATGNRSHLYQSSNQVKVVDHLDEIRSIDTEYLKKKLFYSVAKSEGQAESDSRSVALEKGMEQIFNFPSPSFKKLSTTDQSRYALGDSSNLYKSLYSKDYIYEIDSSI